MGITLMPWQETAARYLTATAPDGGPLYHEVAIVVARQQGKTTLMRPLIIQALRAGKKVMHIAQTRELPRQMFRMIANTLSSEPELFLKREGKTIKPRHGAGQEEVLLTNGGSYRIAAASNGSGRGWTNDLVIIDELREMTDMRVIDAAMPTLTMTKGQMIYLSNAGSDASMVLNAVRARHGDDPDLAYLEWSADPERRADDPVGWAQANPAMGHFPIIGMLERQYRSAMLSGNLAGFETEHLCRWVVSMRERLVDAYTWGMCEVPDLAPAPERYMGVAMDPGGRRASVVIAWRMADETLAVRHIHEGIGSPIDPDLFGVAVRDLARDHRVTSVGYDPLTDGQLAKYLLRPEKITGARFANASSTFRLAVHSRKLRHHDCGPVTDDLTFTAVKPHDQSGSFQAVRSDDDRPITAALAAIRAVELAANPPRGVAQLW